MSRTWEDNAREFGALTKQGVDVRLALLVACSVEKGKGQGERTDLVANTTKSGKTSGKEFGRASETTADRILRHLDAWDKAAAAGLCQPSHELSPSDADDPNLAAPEADEFADVYNATNAGTRPRASNDEITDAIANKQGYAAKLVASMPDDAKTQLAKAIAADPTASHKVMVERVQHGLSDEERAQLARDKQERKRAAKEQEARRKTLADEARPMTTIGLANLATASAMIREWIDASAARQYRLDDEARDTLAAFAEDLDNYVGVLREIALGTITVGLSDDDVASLLDGGR